RHIDKTEPHAIFFQECEAQIDGDSAALLFRKTIRMRSGQRFNQRRFPVIDVTGRANNYAFHLSGHDSNGRTVLPLWMLLEERIGGQTAETILRRRFRRRWIARPHAE